MVDRITESIRNVIADLHPSVLDDFGLTAAMRCYGDTFCRRSGIPVTMHVNEFFSRLPMHIESVLFRIFQEALTNVWKHANATEVTVSIEEDNCDVRMTINDNGIGFDTEQLLDSTKEKRGWGLLMMSERAASSGGRFSIESQPGKGTQIIVEVRL
jgi:signal transduction histidine kinase